MMVHSLVVMSFQLHPETFVLLHLESDALYDNDVATSLASQMNWYIVNNGMVFHSYAIVHDVVYVLTE